MLGVLNTIIETIGKPFEILFNLKGETKVSKTIVVTNGKYKDRIFNAEIGKDFAYVTIRSGNEAGVVEIPNGEFEIMENGIAEAFDASDQMFVPESTITINAKKIDFPKGGEYYTGPVPDYKIGGLYNGPIPPVGAPTIIPPPGTPIPLYSKNDIDRIMTGTLEPWPNPRHPDDVENNVDSGDKPTWEKAVERELDQLRAENKALRERSRKKGMKNARLSQDLDTMIQVAKENDKDIKGFIADNDKLKGKINELVDELNNAQREAIKLSQTLQTVREERDKYKRDNEFHINEVEKGNAFRAKLKHGIEELHEQIRDQKLKTQQETARANTAEKDLVLFKKITERLAN